MIFKYVPYALRITTNTRELAGMAKLTNVRLQNASWLASSVTVRTIM